MSADPGDVALVLAARAGDRGAFEALYRRYAPLVHGVLLAAAPLDMVPDLVQDVFVSVLRSLGALDRPETFPGWLRTIARNRARDALRDRRPASELPEDVPARAGSDDGGGAEAEEARRALDAVRALPEAYREPLVLRLVEGLSGPEIAARTGMTPGSVRVNLCRGMKLLRERLSRGVTER